MRLKERREKGDTARQQREEEILEHVARRNELIEVRCFSHCELLAHWMAVFQAARMNGITADNMDEKIRDALENEFLEDFTISPTTGEKKVVAYKDIQ